MIETPVRPKGLDGPQMAAWEADLPPDERAALGRAEVTKFEENQSREATARAARERERAYSTPEAKQAASLERIEILLEAIRDELRAAREPRAH
jgi:hypothetical protein